MPKYRPESRNEIKRKVDDLDYKARDHTRHMGNVVKEKKVIADVSKKLRLGVTIEGTEKIKQYLQGAGKESTKEWGHLGKKLESIVNEEKKVKNELGSRTKDSMQNYEKLTKASSSIKETPAAKNEINQAIYAVQEDRRITDSLHDNVGRNIKRTNQDVRNQRYEIGNTLLFLNSGQDRKYWIQAHQADQAVMQKKRNENKGVPSEVKIVPQENQDDKVCPRAEKKIRKAIAEERLEAKLEAGQHIQDGKQVQVADETPKKHDHNYGRRSVVPGEQDNTYKP